MSKLTEFYTNLIDLCGIEISNHGRLVFPIYGEAGESTQIPLQYDNKPIVFPDKLFLEDPENKPGDVIVLHPLSESSMRAPSEVQEVLRKAAIARICAVGDFLLKRAIKINHDACMDTNIKLNHKLSKLFTGIDGVDVKFVNWFNKIDKAMQENTAYRLFNIFLRLNGEVGKNNYSRVCIISSPLYDELKLAENTTIWGVEGGRKKDIATLISILEALFPELARDGYVFGSSSGTAPTLMAFMEGVALIADRFNKLLIEYGKEAKGIERGTTRSTDFDRKVKLSALRSAHPTEDYNIGVGKDTAEKRSSEPETKRESEPTRLETHKVAPEALSVAVRQTTAVRTEQPREETEKEAGVPEGAFWLDDRETRRENYRDRGRDDRDERYDRDRGYDDRYDRRDERYSSRGRDDRRENYRDRPSRENYRDRDRGRDDRYSSRDRDRGGRDERYSSRDRDDRQGYGGQFWEQSDRPRRY